MFLIQVHFVLKELVRKSIGETQVNITDVFNLLLFVTKLEQFRIY